MIGSHTYDTENGVGIGAWFDEEHAKFVAGLAKFGKSYKNIAKTIDSRTYSQVKSYGRRYFGTGGKMPGEPGFDAEPLPKRQSNSTKSRRSGSVEQKDSATSSASKKKRRTTNNNVTIDMTKLLICIAIDTLGSANEAIPIVGEVIDVIYAPIAALLLRQLFQGSNVVLLLEFVEEILPFTDILPLATICWVIETFFSGGDIARVLRIGDFGNEQLMKMKIGSRKETDWFSGSVSEMVSSRRGEQKLILFLQ